MVRTPILTTAWAACDTEKRELSYADITRRPAPSLYTHLIEKTKRYILPTGLQISHVDPASLTLYTNIIWKTKRYILPGTAKFVYYGALVYVTYYDRRD